MFSGNCYYAPTLLQNGATNGLCRRHTQSAGEVGHWGNWQNADLFVNERGEAGKGGEITGCADWRAPASVQVRGGTPAGVSGDTSSDDNGALGREREGYPRMKQMGACGHTPRVAAAASRTALPPLEVGRLRLRGRALPGTLPPPLMRHYQLDGAPALRVTGVGRPSWNNLIRTGG